MKAFIISLKNISTSYQSALESLEALKSAGFDAELFEGTYGNDAERLFRENNITFHDTTVDSNNFKLTSPGVKGCFYSHYRLWKLCVELNTEIAIFEDDVVISRKFVPVNFDEVLVVSINYDWKMVDRYKKYLEEDFPVSAIEYNEYHMPGCSGYILKPSVAKLLVDTYKNSYLPADWAINSKLCKIKLHSNLIGRSKTMNEKQSLTRFKGWI